MSGVGLTLNIAKDALEAQRYGMDVTAHNIANVHTPGYSKQAPLFEPEPGQPYGGVLLGRGVNVAQVTRSSDQFVENQLMKQKSSMEGYREMSNYMSVLEGLFSENGDSTLSASLEQFWNTWHDLSTNPAGASERVALYEHSVMLAEQFKTRSDDLAQLEVDLTNALTSGVLAINEITADIAAVNGEIVGMEVDRVAADLRDKRNSLVSELAEYLDVKTFEQENGTISVITAKGCVLVQGTDNYELSMGGANGDRVEWTGSGGATVDLTDYFTSGKMAGWLDIRDEVIAKYEADLDALAKEFVWLVNEQHSQGVGLAGFSSVTGTYQVDDNSEELGTVDSGLDYYDKISNGTLNIWIYDSNGALVGGGPETVTVTANTTTLTSLIDDINGLGADITASESTGRLKLDADAGFTFAFSDDGSGVLAALGVNTFFSGATAGGIGVNTQIGSDKDYIAAAQVDNVATSSTYGLFAAGDNTNAIAIAGLQHTSTQITQLNADRLNGDSQVSVTATIEDYYHSLVGSVGTKALSVSRALSFNEAMTNNLSQIRDSISAVSLDEEMANLIAYQQAYTAATKLITVSDEMLRSLLDTK